MSPIPSIELLWWEGCPSTERAAEALRTALVDVGLPDAEIRRREIRTEEEARAAGFPGSPTILIEGRDPFAPQGEGEPPGLTCRVYRRRDGRVSPIPDPDDLREALRRALADRAEGSK